MSTRETKNISVNIGNTVKELTLDYWGSTRPDPNFPIVKWADIYGTHSPVVLVRIGRGKKLWATGIQVWLNENGGVKGVRPLAVNNRNNLSLMGWNDKEFSDPTRSHHKGQK